MRNSKFGILRQSCRTIFLSRPTEECGLQTDLELVAEEQIIWNDFSRIITEVYGQQIPDHEVRSEIEAYTRPNSSRHDTIAFLQVLDQFYRLCDTP